MDVGLAKSQRHTLLLTPKKPAAFKAAYSHLEALLPEPLLLHIWTHMLSSSGKDEEASPDA